MAILKQEDLPNYLFEDYQLWEGDWELIAGVPYAMSPAPVKKHQMLVLGIGSEMMSSLDNCPLCEVLIDEDWKLDSDTVLRPDVSLVCGDDNPSFISKTPELIFEVLSPTTAKRDEGLKFKLYEEAGVNYYVLVYPDELMARVFQLNNKKFEKAAECDTESFNFENVSCPFKFNFSTIFKRFRK